MNLKGRQFFRDVGKQKAEPLTKGSYFYDNLQICNLQNYNLIRFVNYFKNSKTTDFNFNLKVRFFPYL
jgi:hypothetical protein